MVNSMATMPGSSSHPLSFLQQSYERKHWQWFARVRFLDSSASPGQLSTTIITRPHKTSWAKWKCNRVGRSIRHCLSWVKRESFKRSLYSLDTVREENRKHSPLIPKVSPIQLLFLHNYGTWKDDDLMVSILFMLFTSARALRASGWRQFQGFSAGRAIPAVPKTPSPRSF